MGILRNGDTITGLVIDDSKVAGMARNGSIVFGAAAPSGNLITSFVYRGQRDGGFGNPVYRFTGSFTSPQRYRVQSDLFTILSIETAMSFDRETDLGASVGFVLVLEVLDADDNVLESSTVNR